MARAVRAVTIIPPTINPLTKLSTTAVVQRRVAGYARVSTDSDEQFTSYEAQIDYYTQYIKRRSDWQFVKVYTDEGISGCNTKHREGFNEMVADALNGKPDLIVTKSVSRFARNTVDSLTTVRKLKDAGVEVFFEKENIYTFDSKGELLITIMSSLAQEESRSISENVTWGQRKRFADGKVSLPYKQFLGYRKGADDLPEIVPEEAEIVRLIYRLFLEGKTPGGIARLLTEMKIPTPAGKEKWPSSTIESILTNEKYKGAALLQKGYTVNFLTKEKRCNRGEIPQYYIEHSHPAIIPPEDWELVQAEMQRRKALGRKYSGCSIFSSRIVCGDCGEFYGPKQWHSGTAHQKTMWRCNHKYSDGKTCNSAMISEDQIKAGFLTVMNRMLINRDAAIEDCILIRNMLADCTAIDAEMETLSQEMQIVSELTNRCIEDNSRRAQDQTEFTRRYNSLVERYDAAKARYDSIGEERDKKELAAVRIDAFVGQLREGKDILQKFDSKLWIAAVDTVTVYEGGKMVYRLVTGVELVV